MCLKSLLKVLVFSGVTCSYAVCNFVVTNTYSTFSPNTEAQIPQGMEMAPLCSDLPQNLRDGAYGLYCNNPSYNPQSTIYAQYSVSSCKYYVGSPWIITNNTQLLGSHTVTQQDLESATLIILSYPDQFESGN